MDLTAGSFANPSNVCDKDLLSLAAAVTLTVVTGHCQSEERAPEKAWSECWSPAADSPYTLLNKYLHEWHWTPFSDNSSNPWSLLAT
jgi:hypothetical protein